MGATIVKPDFGELDLSNRGGFMNGFPTLDAEALGHSHSKRNPQHLMATAFMKSPSGSPACGCRATEWYGVARNVLGLCGDVQIRIYPFTLLLMIPVPQQNMGAHKQARLQWPNWPFGLSFLPASCWSPKPGRRAPSWQGWDVQG